MKIKKQPVIDVDPVQLSVDEGKPRAPMFFSQFGQDKFLDEKIFNKKENGFFVDVGAHDGVALSNTYFFEKERNWSGICIEPTIASSSIIKRRKNSKVVVACAGDKAHENEIVKLRQRNPMAVSVTIFEENHKYEHEEGKFMDKFMICKTLESILDEYSSVDQHIDYLSIDTEGCEYIVMKDFPFKKWGISAVTIANNLYYKTPEITENRKAVKKLFEKNNFVLYKEFSLKEMEKENWGKEFKEEILEDLYVNKDFVKKNKLK